MNLGDQLRETLGEQADMQYDGPRPKWTGSSSAGVSVAAAPVTWCGPAAPRSRSC